MITIIVILIIFLICVFKLRKLKKQFNYFAEKGIVHAKFDLRNQILLQNKPLTEVLLDISEKFQDAKIAGIFNFTEPVFFVNDPYLANMLLVKDFEYFSNNKDHANEAADKLFAKSITRLKSGQWKEMRAALSPMFTASKTRRMHHYLTQTITQITESLKTQLINGRDNDVDAKEIAKLFASDIIASIGFGIEVNSAENPENFFFQKFNKSIDFANLKTQLILLGYTFLPGIMRTMKAKVFDEDLEQFIINTVSEMIKRRQRSKIHRHDLIDILTQIKSETENVTNDVDLAAQAFLFYLAGFETISTAVSFLAYELVANPEIQEKLYEEMHKMQTEIENEISYDQIQSLQYLDMCVHETLRKWPTSGLFLTRCCSMDYNFDFNGQKFVIEAGKTVMVPLYSFHFDPKYFPEPEKFKPERFSEKNAKRQVAYMPFGLAPRNCIAPRFAILELKLTMFSLLTNFKLEKSEKTQIPIKLEKKPIGLKAENGIWLKFTPRTKLQSVN